MFTKCHKSIIKICAFFTHTIAKQMPKEALTLAYASYDPTDSPDNTSPNPLIISHGLLGSKTNWNRMCKHYVEKTVPKRKIIAVDARNHGDSPHNPSHTYEHGVLDLRQFYSEMKISKACLLGHSMGGRTSMLFALKNVSIIHLTPLEYVSKPSFLA